MGTDILLLTIYGLLNKLVWSRWLNIGKVLCVYMDRDGVGKTIVPSGQDSPNLPPRVATITAQDSVRLARSQS